MNLLKLLGTVLLTIAATSLAAQTLEIRLVDGRNGHPMVGASSYVNVWVGGERKEALAIPTDDKGVTRLQLTQDSSKVNVPYSTGRGTIVASHPVVQYDNLLSLNTPYIACEAGETLYSALQIANFDMKVLLGHGYASTNKCGKVTALPQPGRIVLFVRPLTLWEKLKQ